MRRLRLVPAALAVLLGSAPALATDAVPGDARARVEHHLREAEPIVRHLEAVLAEDCPRFPTAREWRAYLDGELERVVLLVAHIEQAWVEAKRAPDDDTRRVAKAPRRQLDRVQRLVDKLQGCAGDNGSDFQPMAVWRRIERDVPRRQADIALPR